MNQTIIALAAGKSGGKNTAANFILRLHLLGISVVKNNFSILEDGKLYLTDVWGDTNEAGIFDVQRGTPEMDAFLAEHVDPYIRLYSFADLLKQEVCMKIFGLTYEQCYGTDEQKNELTYLMWENMPGVITNKLLFEALGRKIVQCCTEQDNYLEYKDENFKLIYHKPGPMSAREFMQFVGSDVFRKMYGDVWVNALIKRIKEEGSSTAIITDCRFPNEVNGVQKENGKVIYLTRKPYEDGHISETALNPENFDHSKFDKILDNQNMSIDEQNKAIYHILKEWGLLPIEIEEYS